MTEKKEMCVRFKELFKHYTPGVDFIIIGEKEAEVDRENGESVGKYNLDFEELKEEALRNGPGAKRGCLVGFNGGVFSAFDAATETFVVSARPDIYHTIWNAHSDGLFVPFSQHDTMPADPQKAAAYLYQEAYRMALYYKCEEKNSEQMVDYAEKAKTYKLQAMGEGLKTEKKKTLSERLEDFSDRYKKARRFMSDENMRQYSAKDDIERTRRDRMYRLATSKRAEDSK